MAKTIEIRVHGVGGTPPEHLLGEASPDDVVRIAGSGESAFYRRTRDPAGGVEGYAWGRLTSKALLQPLWVLLLPFTLANAAGWMLPAPTEARWRWSWRSARGLILALGALLTVGYSFGVSIVVVKEIFYQWGSTWSWSFAGWLADHPGVRVFLGGVVSAAIGSLFAHMARRTQRGFEAVNGPVGNPSDPDAVGLLQFRVEGTRRLDIDESLDEEEFWSRARRARTSLKVHWMLWIAGVALFTSVAMSNATVAVLEPPRNVVLAVLTRIGVVDRTITLEGLGLDPLFMWLGVAQVTLLILLLCTLAAGFRNPWQNFVTGHFRAFGPCVAFSTAISLAAAFFSALAVVTANALQRITDGVTLPRGGPEYDLDVAFGVGSLTFLVSGVLIAAALYLRGRKLAKEISRGSGDPPVNTAPACAYPNGIVRHKVGGLAQARAFSLGIRNADLALTAPAVTFAPFAVWTLAAMCGRVPYPHEADCFGRVDCLAWLDGLGGWLTGAAVTALIGTLLHGYFKDSQRRTIGIVWDVLTFWPRRFHPLAVRPYAERAVPELQCRIVDHLRRDPKTTVILSAHSQGSILAYAGLVQLAEHTDDIANRVCLVTYGSPLSRLHSCFFPGYFDGAGFANLMDRLRPGTIGPGGPRLGWRNFYRRTDYIGQRVELAPAPSPDPNVVVDDPPTTPSDANPSLFERPDPLRPAWVELALHSDYNSEIALRRWKKALCDALAGPDAEPPVAEAPPGG